MFGDEISTIHTTGQKELAVRLQQWARGMYTLEAAVDLLIATGLYLRVAADRRVMSTGEPGGEQAWIDWEELAKHAGSGVYSGGERRMLLIACAIAGQPVEFDVSTVDTRNLAIVLAAVTHAAGHDHRARPAAF